MYARRLHPVSYTHLAVYKRQVMLIVYGIAFILIERRPRVPATTKLSRITYKQAIIVGAWQVLSLIHILPALWRAWPRACRSS